ncbi:unnamed protein product [Chrysodeixis includens]|uniref:Uncharacterized protein n=1 Tax=Chrysodeixis includens TaxID=689277 RepID=A0A9P0FY61_CHRIL|nr:unnamed protein product [Chrysodeixis includens]
MLLLIPVLAEEYDCDHIQCSNVYDRVCGMATTTYGAEITMSFHNICQMRKKECKEKSIIRITQVLNAYCDLEEITDDLLESYSGRRGIDHGTTGAQQSCNHTCPTYCTDAYEPACAKIWSASGEGTSHKPMINHCHVDLYSCSTGLNVTIETLNKCYKTGMGLVFMLQVAQMKSLRVLDDDPFGSPARSPARSRPKSPARPPKSRRSSQMDQEALKEQLLEVVRRIFDKYRNPSNDDDD